MSNYSGSLDSLIANFETSNEHGFTIPEVDNMLKRFPDINTVAFDEVLQFVDCTVVGDDFLYNHSDVLKALKAGIEGIVNEDWCHYSGMPSPEAYKLNR